MKSLLAAVNRHARVVKILGVKEYLKYSLKLRGDITEVSINNVNVFIRSGSTDLEVAISCLTGEFEALRYLYDSDFNGVIVDAGGYIGTAAIALSRIFPNATVLTIEPSIENFSILQKNIAQFENIKSVFGALVAKDDGNISLVNRGTGQWGYTAVQGPLDNLDASAMHDTPTVSLSSLSVSVDEIGILKLDIEGGEYDLFVNDTDNLANIPNIIIELHDRIVDGCSAEFFKFSKERIVIKDAGEKFLSIKK